MTAMMQFPYHYAAAPEALPYYRWAGGLIVDNFAGGGGASTGIWKALGVSPDIAVNHNAKALAMHARNHPTTKHYNESVWDIDVRKATGGKPVLVGWFSPDCTHFSGARGGTPVKKNIRGLAWVAKKWAGQSDMACFLLENVKEFQTWGPLIAKRCKVTGRVIKLVPTAKKTKKGDIKMEEVVSQPGERVPFREQALIPDKKRSGETFRKFCKQLRAMGYDLGFNDSAVAYDYGDGTIRKRFVMVARKDGLPLNLAPTVTHGDPKKKGFAESGLLPWVTAGQKLDFSLPCPSIFTAGRDLAPKTMERIFKGYDKFVKQAGDNAFLVKVNHGYDQFRGQSVEEPLQTITGVRGTALVEASLITCIDHGSTNDPSQSCNAPLSSVTSKARHVKVAAMLKHYTGVVGAGLDKPAPTITAVDHNSVMEASLVEAAHIQRDFGNSVGHGADEPLGSVMPGGGGKAALVTTHLIRMKGTCKDGQAVDEPLGGIQAQGNHYGEVRTTLQPCHNTSMENGGAHEGVGSIQTAHADGSVQGGAGWDGLEDGQPHQQRQVEADRRPADRHTRQERVSHGALLLEGQGLSDQRTSVGVSAAGGADTEGAGHQPQGRGEAQQQAQQPGTDDQGQQPQTRLRDGIENPQAAEDCRQAAEQGSGTKKARKDLASDSRSPGMQSVYGLPGRVETVHAFLQKYYMTGAIGQPLSDPIHTIRAGDTFALVTIHGVDYQVVDIGMRMLEPHELYACQGFPDDYEHRTVVIDGQIVPLSKADQVRMVGNSVPPGMACAFVQANIPPWAVRRQQEAA